VTGGGWRGIIQPLVVGCALLAVVLGATTWFLARQEAGNAAIRHTLTVDNQVSAVLSRLQDAETGQRGYLLSGEDSYLEPYRVAVAALDHELADLRTTVADNPAQVDLAAQLTTLVTEKLAELRATIEQRQRGNVGQALALVHAGTGKAVMDQARTVIAAMRAEEERLLTLRQSSLENAGRWLQLGILSGIVLLILLAVGAVRDTERRAALARFLPEEVAPRLAAAGLREGRRQTASILFLDLRDSTALAERMDPKRLLIFITSFRRRVIAARAHGGVVDKFIGDGALIVFGVPEASPDDAARALACARRLDALIAGWNAKRRFDPPLRIGVGVHCGEILYGVVGDASRLELTVLGDAVNVAARLEQATKRWGTPILASAAVVGAAGEADGWCEVTDEPLPGRSERLAILAPVGAPPRARSLPAPLSAAAASG
jgi:adenylate cyclase